ncbi:MAG: nitrate reductase molybdenum cofactor assembly chaperone [Pseudomonadales bacterium]
MSTLKIIAALLHYPDDQLQEHADELIEMLRAEQLITGARSVAVQGFIGRLRDTDLLDLQAEYVETFDRGRSRSLYLYEHVHGESRDRGPAMVELIQIYRSYGFELSSAELPDYLPLFLEFLDSLPLDDALTWLEDVGHVLQLLHARLAERGSPFAVIFEPLVRLAGLAPEEAVRQQVAKETPDDTPEALDRAWMEAPVTFGQEGGSGAEQQVSATQQANTAQPLRWQDSPQ